MIKAVAVDNTGILRKEARTVHIPKDASTKHIFETFARVREQQIERAERDPAYAAYVMETLRAKKMR